MRIEIGTDCPALADGFHQDEGSHRWTDGHAALPRKMLVTFAGEIIAEVRIGATELHYPMHNEFAVPTASLDK